MHASQRSQRGARFDTGGATGVMGHASPQPPGKSGTSLLDDVAARLSEHAWQVFQGTHDHRVSVAEGAGPGPGVDGSSYATVGSVAEGELRSEPLPSEGSDTGRRDSVVGEHVRAAGRAAAASESEPAAERRPSFTSILEDGGKGVKPSGEGQEAGAGLGDGGRGPSAAGSSAAPSSPSKSLSGSQGQPTGGSLRPQAAMRSLMKHDYLKTQLARVERRPALAIHPDSTWRLAWDLFVAMIIIYSVVMVPWRIAFESEAQGAWLAVDVTADCLFTADIIANFRTGYRNTLGVVTWRGMARHYARRWFTIDLLSVLPIDLIVRLVQGDDQASVDASVTLRATRLLRLFRLLRLLRMLKLLRLGRLYDAINNLPVNRNVVALVGLLLQIMFLAHIVGCLWHWNAIIAGDTEATWLVASGLRDAPPLERYVAAVHWALATMTTVGFGDIKPENSRERGLSMVAMLLGATVFGYNIVSVSELVENLDPRAALFRERMQEVAQYTRERRFPPDLARRVRHHFRFARAKRSLHDEDTLVEAMSSPLASAVLCGTYGAALSDIPFLRDSHVSFAAAVARRLRFATFPRHVALFRDGDLATELYFVRSGRVEKRLAATTTQRRTHRSRVDPALLGVAGAGAVVGETVLLAAAGGVRDVEQWQEAWEREDTAPEDDPTLTALRPYSALVLEDAEVLVLSRGAARELMNRHREHMVPLMQLASTAAAEVVRARARAMQAPLARALSRWHLMQVATAFDTWFVRACTRAADEEREAAKEAAEQPSQLCRPGAWSMPPPIPSSHPLKVRWDMYVGVCILYSAVMVPWRLASDTEAQGPGRALDTVVDVTFVLDLLLSFRTTFYEGDAGNEVTDGRRIVVNYLRTWFPIDVASVFPFDLLFQSSSSSLRSTRLLRALRLARLFKLVRMARLRNSAEERKDGLSLNPAVSRLLSRFLVMGLAAHLLACAWVAVPNATPAGEDWRDHYCTGVAQDGSGDPHCARQFDTGSLYLASFYWGIVALSTTGYGDIVPATVEGMLVAMLATLVGAAMFAFVVGGMLGLVMQVDPVARARREERTALDGYLDEQEAPRALHRITRRAFEHVQLRRSAFAEAQMLEEMPDTLRAEAAQFAFREVTATVPILAVAEAAFPGIMAVLGPMLSFVRVEEGDRVFVAGRSADTVYFVQHGVMEVALELGAEEEEELRQGRARASAGTATAGRDERFRPLKEEGEEELRRGRARAEAAEKGRVGLMRPSEGKDGGKEQQKGPADVEGDQGGDRAGSESSPSTGQLLTAAAPSVAAASFDTDANADADGGDGDGVLRVGGAEGASRRSNSDGDPHAVAAAAGMGPGDAMPHAMEAATDWAALSAVSEEKDGEGVDQEHEESSVTPGSEAGADPEPPAGDDAESSGHAHPHTTSAAQEGAAGDSGSTSGEGNGGKRYPPAQAAQSSGETQRMRPSLLEAQAVSFDTSASPPPESPALPGWRRRVALEKAGSGDGASEGGLHLLEEGAEDCFGWVPEPALTETRTVDRTGTRFFARGDCLGGPLLCLPPEACVQLRVTVKARRRRQLGQGDKGPADVAPAVSPTVRPPVPQVSPPQGASSRSQRRASSVDGRASLPPLAAQASMQELDVDEHPPEGSFADLSHVDNAAAADGVTGKDQLPGRARAVQRAFEGEGGGCAHLVGLSREAFASVCAVAPHVARWMVAALGASDQLGDWLVVTEEECDRIARRWPAVEELRQRQRRRTRLAAEAALVSAMNEDVSDAALAVGRTSGTASTSGGDNSESHTGSSSRGRSQCRHEDAHGSLIRSNTRRLSVVRRGSKRG